MCSFSAADMDARSVMEQRLQAMVCCFSMVQRVLARQPQDDSTVVSSSTTGYTTQSESSKRTSASTNTPHHTDCSTNNLSSSSSSGASSSSNNNSRNSSSTAIPECEQGFEGKLPTRAVSAGEATERIWKYLSAVPSLMEVRIFVCSVNCTDG